MQRAGHLRTQPRAEHVQGVWRNRLLHTRPPQEPVQRMQGWQHLRAQQSAQPMPRLRRKVALRARQGPAQMSPVHLRAQAHPTGLHRVQSHPGPRYVCSGTYVGARLRCLHRVAVARQQKLTCATPHQLACANISFCKPELVQTLIRTGAAGEQDSRGSGAAGARTISDTEPPALGRNFECAHRPSLTCSCACCASSARETSAGAVPAAAAA